MGQILAERLAEGPLPLELALRYATDIVSELREMQADGRAHGALDLKTVLLRPSGAELLPPKKRPRYADPISDLRRFGAILYALLNGERPSGDEFRVVPAKPASVRGPEGVKDAALRLAERCLTAERETAPDLQKVLTEVRLLNVMARQFSAEASALERSHAPVAPITSPLTLAALKGEAKPPNRPPLRPPGVGPDRPGGTALQTGPDGAPLPNFPKPPRNPRLRSSRARPKIADILCPRCHGYHIRLSKPKTRWEKFLSLLGIPIHRCHRCLYRYVAFMIPKTAPPPKEETVSPIITPPPEDWVHSEETSDPNIEAHPDSESNPS